MKKRVFVAIELSSEAKQRVLAFIESLQKDAPPVRVGWEKAEKLHLTIKFFGDIDVDRIEKLIRLNEKIGLQVNKFKSQISGTGVFPNPSKPRILWLGCRDEGRSLERLQKLLESEYLSLGFPRERKKFQPHLTIGRLREPHKSEKLVKKHLADEFEPVEFEVAAITVFESRLLPTGSVYNPIHRSYLAK